MGILNISTEQQIKEQVAASGKSVAENQFQQSLDLSKEKRLNLIDAKAIITGKRLTTDGKGLENSSANSTTDFIPVNVHFGTTLYCSRTPGRCFRYNIDKQPIDSATIASATVTITPDTKYVRFSYGTADFPTVRVAYSPVLNYPYYAYEEVQPIKVSEDKITDRDIWDRNLFDKNKAAFGYYVDPLGNMVESATYATSDYIPVSREIWPTLRFQLRNGNVAVTRLLGIAFYDNRFRLISYNRTLIAGNTFAIIEGASYVRIMTDYSADNVYLCVVKYDCFAISNYWFDLAIYDTNKTPGRIDPTQYISEVEIAGTGNTLMYGLDKKMSPLIPVLPGERYYTNRNTYIYMFSKNRTSLGRHIATDEPYFTVPPDCYYVVFNETAWTINSYRPFERVGNVDNLGELVCEDDKVKAFLTNVRKPPFTVLRTIKGVFENHVVLCSETAVNGLYYSSNGFNGTYKFIDTSSLPNLASGEVIERVVFFYTKEFNTDIRALLFGTKKGLWCSCLAPAYDSSNTYSNGDICSESSQNYKCIAESSVTGTWDSTKWEAISNEFGYFEQCNIWDMKGNHHWRVADDDKDPSGVRYRKYYDNRPDSIGRFTYYTGPIWMMGSGQYARGLMFGNYSDNRRGNLSEPACMFLTLDGKNVYVQYEFGVYPRQYKKGGSSEIINNTAAVAIQSGDVVDFTDFVGTQSYTIKKRIGIVPSSEEKDPVLIFEYGNELTVTGISGSSITLSDASSLAVGDHIVITGSATGDYAKLLTSNIDSTSGVGDGNVFIVTAKNGNVITIADSIGNPKNNLFCRHIHGISNFGNGVCMFTGEQYPDGWFIYVCPDMDYPTDSTVVNSSRWKDSVVRLNAAENGHQRSLGVYLRKDGKMVSISDNSGPYASRLQVRGKDIMMGNFGVYVFSLSEIDDVEGQLSKIPNLNACYALYNIGGLLFLSDKLGQTYYSTDEGDTWKHICTAGSDKNKLVGFDKNEKRFFFNYTNGNQFIVEVK